MSSPKKVFTQVGDVVRTEPASINFSKDSYLQDAKKGVENLKNSFSLPWKGQEDVFFKPKDIDAKRVNKIYPYKLVVIDISKNNQIVNKTDLSGERFFIESKFENGGSLFSTTFGGGKWEITLPVTPQQLNTTDLFSINTTPTARGVVEEHNGVVFKNISVSGTTGIWPQRDRYGEPSADKPNSGLSLFGGVTEAAGQLGRAFTAFKESTLVQQKSPPKFLDPTGPGTGGGVQTGYYQAELLQQFLEQYAVAKKDPKNKNWRLVWWTPKTNEALVVTPVQFSLNKTQASPLETFFSMQFKAWKRIKLGESDFKKKDSKINQLSPSYFQRAVSVLDNLRSVAANSINLVKAVRSDFRKPFDQLRKLTLFIKDFAGLAVTIADLPDAIARDITSATEKRVADLNSAAELLSQARPRPSQPRSEQAVTKTFNEIKSLSSQNEGLSADDVERGLNGKSAKDLRNTNSLNNIYDQREQFFDFFNAIPVDSLELTRQQRTAIEEEIELTSLLSIEEIREIVRDIQDLALDISNIYGAGNELFSRLYNRPAPRKRALPMSVEEFEFLTALEEAVLQANLLISNRAIEDVRTQNPLEYVGGLAAESEIEFNSSSTSKFLAPVPFGLNIQQLAARYLDNPDRWIEIVTLNNLRSPYIDEDGFFYNLLSNGEDRQFTVASKENLYVGQKIQLSSNTVPVFIRKITDIKRISESNFLITVDGAADLAQLKTIDQAKIRAFLPGTINSQNQIFIPSDEFLPDEPRDFDIPYLKNDPLTGFSKIDWLLTDSGDIVLNSFGEVGLANGLTNIVQALKMMINTAKGDILSNPEYGSGVSPGVMSSDLIPGEILNSIRNTITSDPRFSGVENVEIFMNPPTLAINIQATLANGRGLFPINFSVPM